MRESAGQALRGRYPEQVSWVAGADKDTEYTYDVATEDITTRYVPPTDQDPHDTLRVNRYGSHLRRRTVDIQGDYGFVVGGSGVGILPDHALGPAPTRVADDTRPLVRPRTARPADREESTTHGQQEPGNAALYERLMQPSRSGNRRSPNRQGPLGGKPKQGRRVSRAKRHPYWRGREK